MYLRDQCAAYAGLIALDGLAACDGLTACNDYCDARLTKHVMLIHKTPAFPVPPKSCFYQTYLPWSNAMITLISLLVATLLYCILCIHVIVVTTKVKTWSRAKDTSLCDEIRKHYNKTLESNYNVARYLHVPEHVMGSVSGWSVGVVSIERREPSRSSCQATSPYPPILCPPS